MEFIQLAAGWVIVVFMGAMGLIIIIMILKGKPDGIDLQYLVSEANGDASLSRFQFLIFTFVIAMGLLVVILQSGEFPQIGGDVFGLLGISAGSYVGSKITQRVTPKTPSAETELGHSG